MRFAWDEQGSVTDAQFSNTFRGAQLSASRITILTGTAAIFCLLIENDAAIGLNQRTHEIYS